MTQPKKCAKITDNLLTATHKSKVIKFKLYEDPLQRRVYFLSFINSPKIVLSIFSETYTLLMDYPYIRGEELPYYDKKST